MLLKQITIIIALNYEAKNDSYASIWRAYDYDKIINRNKASLDISWLKDKSLEDSKNLSDPGILAQEIVEDLEIALEQFREIAEDLVDEGAA